MRNNPLLPIPPRIKVAHHSDVRVGVHTTDEIERAVWYAVSAAATNDPDDEQNVGIILELDTSGLVPVPDYDALYLQETIGGIAEQELLEEEEALAALADEDGETLIDIAQNIVENSEFIWDERIENWNDALRMYIGGESPADVLNAFGDLYADEAVEAAQLAKDTGLFPLEIYMEAINQRRYFQPIGFDRLRMVYTVHPVDVERVVMDWPEEDYPAEGEAPLALDVDYPIPPTEILWVAKDRNHRDKVEYHGTDLFSARAAFPEIADKINNPWDFGQPYNPIRWQGWAKPTRVGVGVYPVAEDTGRMLVGLRSKRVQTPGHWSGFGGLLEPGESFEEAARRELREETGYRGSLRLVEFAPSMFFGYVPCKFTPKLNWETDKALWVEPEEIEGLYPRHWGLDILRLFVLQGKSGRLKNG